MLTAPAEPPSPPLPPTDDATLTVPIDIARVEPPLPPPPPIDCALSPADLAPAVSMLAPA